MGWKDDIADMRTGGGRGLQTSRITKYGGELFIESTKMMVLQKCMYYHKYKTSRDSQQQNVSMMLDVIQVVGFHIHEMTSIRKADESFNEAQCRIYQSIQTVLAEATGRFPVQKMPKYWAFVRVNTLRGREGSSLSPDLMSAAGYSLGTKGLAQLSPGLSAGYCLGTRCFRACDSLAGCCFINSPSRLILALFFAKESGANNRLLIQGSYCSRFTYVAQPPPRLVLVLIKQQQQAGRSFFLRLVHSERQVIP